MALNFPSSPVDGQTYSSGTGGPTYRYHASTGVWNIDKTGGSGNVFVSDIAPVNPFPGMRWYRSTDMKEFIYYVDTDGGQWIETSYADSQRPASDGKDYVMRDGVWISVRDKIDLSAGTVTLSVPSWATRFKFDTRLNLASASSNQLILEFGVGGSFFTTSGNYLYSATTFNTSSSSMAYANDTVQVGFLLTIGGDSAVVSTAAEGIVDIARTDTTRAFGLRSSTSGYSGSGIIMAQTHQRLVPAVTTALRITDLRLRAFAANFASGSHINIEWRA